MNADTPLDRLAKAHGVLPRYLNENKEWQVASDASKRKVLQIMGVGAADDAEVAASLARAPAPVGRDHTVPDDVRCFMPPWLERGKCWGVTCQLYGLRSRRNDGIGDFEDLARLAECVAAAGGDMLGTNPLHALFTADPGRCSPFAPSSRRFLNPLYIALDGIPGIDGKPPTDARLRAQARRGKRIDYPAVARLKLSTLHETWRRLAEDRGLWHEDARRSFDAFIRAGGDDLRRHALFEALSHHMAGEGFGAGWQSWPRAYQDHAGRRVKAFARAHGNEIDFHTWLQWIARIQLDTAAARAKAAGMRIGLYLDLAVGNAPDGSATWADPALIVSGAHIGAPPDTFFTGGQDWGLAPMSPLALRARDYAPFRGMLDATMRHAGAIRIDHAMSLTRLYWIPAGHPPADGCYVRYPLADLARKLADISRERGAIVIGEDLGTVPEGFSETMRRARMLSCRVLYFERTRTGFRAGSSFPRDALLSASTHDLPPLATWWAADDAGLFRRLGLLDADEAEARRAERAADRRALVERIRKEAARRPFAIPPPGGNRGDRAGALTPSLAAAIHAYLARTPCRILALQYEDLCGAQVPVNVPGTSTEYPNWRLRAPVGLEAADSGKIWNSVIGAVARERPRRE